MTQHDYARQWLNEFLKEQRERHRLTSTRLATLQHPTSTYAEGLRVITRVYEAAIAAAEAELAKL
jgi:hypothetical protein